MKTHMGMQLVTKRQRMKHMPCAAGDHHKEGWLPNMDVKSSWETLVSEDLQFGQCNRLTKMQSRASSEEENSQTSSFRPKAPKGSSNVKDHQEGEGLLTTHQ